MTFGSTLLIHLVERGDAIVAAEEAHYLRRAKVLDTVGAYFFPVMMTSKRASGALRIECFAIVEMSWQIPDTS